MQNNSHLLVNAFFEYRNKQARLVPRWSSGLSCQYLDHELEKNAQVRDSMMPTFFYLSAFFNLMQ